MSSASNNSYDPAFQLKKATGFSGDFNQRSIIRSSKNSPVRAFLSDVRSMRPPENLNEWGIIENDWRLTCSVIPDRTEGIF
jgi:hypothetical protein